MTNQDRIAQAQQLFELLYAKIPAGNFAYLIKFAGGTKCYTFEINDSEQRKAMAAKAVELSDKGFDLWHSVNPVNVKPSDGKRGDENVVSYQTACIVDIDIKSDAHKADNLVKTFDEARACLPFTPSIIIDSGFGMHAYYLFDKPLAITNLNREDCKRRNKLLLDVIRSRANENKIDAVDDLPRILRTPGTKNYKCGKDNDAPLCRLVEVNDTRFTPEQLDEMLNDFAPMISTPELSKKGDKSARTGDVTSDDKHLSDVNLFRVKMILDLIADANNKNENHDLSWERYLGILTACKQLGLPYEGIVDDFCKRDPTGKYNFNENFNRYNGLKNSPEYGINTLIGVAKRYGYDDADTLRQWYQLHPELSNKQNNSTSRAGEIDSLKARLREVNNALSDFDDKKNAALEKLRKLETFDSATVFSEEVITAAAFAKLFDKTSFTDLKQEIKRYGERNKDSKVSLVDWSGVIKDKTDELTAKHEKLVSTGNAIQAKITALRFAEDNDVMNGFTIPERYSISNKFGVTKTEEKRIVTIALRPIIITGKIYNVEEKIFKLALSYQTQNGVWKKIPAQAASTVFNKGKIIDLADYGLPVASSNALPLVEYLQAFNVTNEDALPLTITVPRCGWYNFKGTDFFVDPRRPCVIQSEERKVEVLVDEQSQFAKSLCTVGSLDEWKRAYSIAKKSPVARFIVAASVAPFLLKILGERNFLVYLYTKSRAGKTTALYLGASAVGNERMIRSFDATRNGLAGAAADVNDFAFLIDEKQSADTRLKEQFDMLTYSLANGLGRLRLNKNASVREIKTWRTIAIATGEVPMLNDNAMDGAFTRMLTIAAPKVILNSEDCRAIREIIALNNGHAFPLVVDKAFELGFDTLRELNKGIVTSFAAKFPDLLEEHNRYMALITVADMLLTSAIFGNCVERDGKTIKAIADAVINAGKIFPLIPTAEENSSTAYAQEVILSFVAKNQNRFMGTHFDFMKMQMIYGKFTPDFIYIEKNILHETLDNAGFDHRKAVADLITAGFLLTSKIEGRKSPSTTVPTRLGKVTVRCYQIKRVNFDFDDGTGYNDEE